jgi:ABC-type amino acid transport substrate-binding protein
MRCTIAMALLAAAWFAPRAVAQTPEQPAVIAPADTAHVGDRPTAKVTIGGGEPLPSSLPKLRVGICDLPPWSVPPNERTPYWSGLAAVAWRHVVRETGIDYSIETFAYADLLAAIEHGDVDVAVTGIAIDPEHMARFALTPPFDETGVSILTRVRRHLSVGAVLERVLHSEVITWMAVLAGLGLAFAAAFWALERRRNPPLHGSTARGLGESAWWSVVTVSTVGYGDRVPLTGRGKLLAALWMAVGFVLLTIMAAVTTSTLTVERLRPVVRGASDLARARVGVVSASAGEDYARAAEIPAFGYQSIEAAIDDLAATRIDAVVAETATLQYLSLRGSQPGLAMISPPLMRDYVGIGMRFGLDPVLQRRLSLEVVRAARSPDYRTFREVMLGAAEGSAPVPSAP